MTVPVMLCTKRDQRPTWRAESPVPLLVMGCVWLAACGSEPSMDDSRDAAAPDAAGMAGGPTENGSDADVQSGDTPKDPDAGISDAGVLDAGELTEDAGSPRERVAVPSNVPADCSTDVTDMLQATLDAVPSGSTLVFPADGCFLVQRMLTFADREDVIIEGNGSVLRRTELTPQALRYPHHNEHLRFERVRDLIVRGLHIEGTNTGEAYGGTILDSREDEHDIDCGAEGFGCYSVGLEFEHAFSFFDSRRARLESSSADAIWGDGVYVSNGRDLVVDDVEIDRNGRQGIAIISGDGMVIDGCRILHSRRGGIDFEPNKPTDRITRVEVRNCEIRSHLLAFPAVGRGEVSDIFIHHNTVMRSGTPWLYSGGSAELPRSGWRVEDNVVESELHSPQPGMRFVYTQEVEIRRNVVPFHSDRGMTAVGLTQQSHAHVECNHFAGAGQISSSDATSTVVEMNNTRGEEAPACEGVSPTKLPAEHVIDYGRVYERAP